MHQTYKVVFLLFDGHLIAIFDATKLPQILVLPIYETHITECAKPKCKISMLDNAIVVKAAEPTGRE